MFARRIIDRVKKLICTLIVTNPSKLTGLIYLVFLNKYFLLMKLWIAVDRDVREFLYAEKPERVNKCFEGGAAFYVKNGTSLSILGRQLTFDDDPVELTVSESTNPDLMSLIKRNYEATVARGLITPRTSLRDFIEKMEEEITELIESIDESEGTFDKKEAFDCFLVAASNLYHFGLFTQLEQKVIINEKRAEMSLEQANKILIDHNNWRRNGSGEMETPYRIGMAIDIVSNHINATYGK